MRATSYRHDNTQRGSDSALLKALGVRLDERLTWELILNSTRMVVFADGRLWAGPPRLVSVPGMEYAIGPWGCPSPEPLGPIMAPAAAAEALGRCFGLPRES